MRKALGQDGHRLDRLDQRGAILRPGIARRLHPRLDDMQRFPAAEHMRIGGHVARVTDRRAALVDTHRRAIGGLMRTLIRLLIAAHAFPEIAVLEELQTGTVNRHRLQTVDKAKERRTLPAKEFAQFLDKGQHGGSDHDVIQNLGVARNLGEILGERGLRGRNRDMCQHFAALRLDRLRKEIAVIMAECEIREHHRDLFAKIRGHIGRHRLNLTFDIRDARLQRVAVEHARGHMMPFRDHEIRQLQFPRTRR